MGDVVYRSVIRLVRRDGAHRIIEMPAGEEVSFGVHSEVAAHYGATEGQYEPHSTTLDYVVAAAGG